ncbi:MAG TPA: FAD-dependent oxidoreductase [Cellvibrionaceae bacterium]
MKRIAVLGGGVMGCCTALCLARLGASVTLFEQHPRIMSEASRWNEGKIHLGYLYAASRTLDTAKKVLTGGLRFRPIVEQLLETSIAPWITPQADHYLVHKNSVVGPQEIWDYFTKVTDLVLEHPDVKGYLRDISPSDLRRLAAADIDFDYNPEQIRLATRVPEYSIDTTRFADALVRRVMAESFISVLTEQSVQSVSPDGEKAERYTVHTGQDTFTGFDAVVNALWAGRPSIDKTIIGRTDFSMHHRYRVSAFLQCPPGHSNHSSAVICAGPFGDIKHYGNGRYYMSWYPAGLLAEGRNAEPPRAPQLSAEDADAVIAKIKEGLGDILPGAVNLLRQADKINVQGGWVYAQATGCLEDPHSSLHSRDKLGLLRHGNYISVDTGKFSVAPYLAEVIAQALG